MRRVRFLFVVTSETSRFWRRGWWSARDSGREQNSQPIRDWPRPSSAPPFPFEPRPLDNFPHAGLSKPPSTSRILPSTQLQLCCDCIPSARHEQTPPQHVPERPPPEHPRRRRLLCHWQSRRGRLTPHTRSTFNIIDRSLYSLIESRSPRSFVIMAHGLEDVDGLVGGAAHVS